MRPSSVWASGSVSTGRSRGLELLGSRETALALRLFALAVACASGGLVESVASHPARFLAGIVVGALLALLQHLLLRWAPRIAGPALLVPHLALWTYLVSVSGADHSPLLVGYLLEVPLAGVVMGRRGIAFAAIGASAAIALSSRFAMPASAWPTLTTAIGFVGIAAVLTSWLLGVVERQQREISVSHEALRWRADGLADELRALGDYMSGGLIAIDELGRVARVNPAGAAILGLAEAQAEGRAWQEVLRPNDAGCAALATAIAGAGEARGLTLLLESQSGRPLNVCADVWTGASREGTRTYVLLDVPAAPATADADPLRQLGLAAANVSHQIKNSLHALQGFARQVQSDQNGGSAGSGATEQLAHALGTLGELAEDVLAMSGAPRPEETVLLEPVLSSAMTLARRSNVRIELRGQAAATTRVRAHRGRLVHALFNLIDNACRATPEGGLVEISVGASDDDAWIEICDRGPGLPLAQAATSAPDEPGAAAAVRPHQAPGHGLGLIATRRFLESFGARLEFLARDGGGARCRVRLERATAAVPFAMERP